MIRFIRRNIKNIFGLFIVFCFSILMLSFGIQLDKGPKKQVAARVGDQEISFQDYARREAAITSNLRQRFGDSFDQIKGMVDIQGQAIDSLVDGMLFNNFKERLGLHASKNEVLRKLNTLPFFSNGATQETLTTYLEAIGLSEGQLFKELESEIVGEQLQKVFTDISRPSYLELLQIKAKEDVRRAFDYVAIKAGSFKDKVDTEDEKELEKYYEDNSASYQTEQKVKYTYVKFAATDFTKDVEVLPEDISEKYQESKYQYKEPAKYHLRVISLMNQDESSAKKDVANEESQNGAGQAAEVETNSEESVEPEERDLVAEASLLRQRVLDGESFQELAKEHSEDETTKESGGDLGFVDLNTYPESLRSKLEKLEPGDVSEVIEQDGKVAIYVLEDYQEPRTKDLEEVKDMVEAEVRRANAPIYAYAAAQDFFNEYASGSEQLTAFAQEREKQAISTKEAVGASSFGEGVEPGITAEAFKLSSGSREVVSIGDDAYLVEVDEIVEPRIPPLSEVRQEVVKAYKEEKSRSMALSQAKDFLESVKNDRGKFSELAKAQGYEVQSTELKTYAEASGKLFSNQELKNASYALDDMGEAVGTVYENAEEYYVVVLKEIEQPDVVLAPEQVASMKRATSEEAAGRLQSALQTQLKVSGNVWTNPELLDSQ